MADDFASLQRVAEFRRGRRFGKPPYSRIGVSREEDTIAIGIPGRSDEGVLAAKVGTFISYGCLILALATYIFLGEVAGGVAAFLGLFVSILGMIGGLILHVPNERVANKSQSLSLQGDELHFRDGFTEQSEKWADLEKIDLHRHRDFWVWNGDFFSVELSFRRGTSWRMATGHTHFEKLWLATEIHDFVEKLKR